MGFGVLIQCALALTAVEPVSGAPIPTPPARVVVLEVQPVDLPGLGRLAIRNTIEAAVKSQGAEIVRPPERREHEAICADASCLARLASATGATHALRIDGVYQNDGFRFTLEIWNAATGQTVQAREKCEICTSAEMIKSVREQTTLLSSQRLGQAGTAGAGTRSDRQTAVAGTGADIGARSTDARDKGTVVPWLLMASGTAGLAGSVLLLKMNNDPADCHALEDRRVCYGRRSTLLGAGILGAAGAAAIGTGLFLLFNPRGERAASTGVVLGPLHVGVAGRF